MTLEEIEKLVKEFKEAAKPIGDDLPAYKKLCADLFEKYIGPLGNERVLLQTEFAELTREGDRVRRKLRTIEVAFEIFTSLRRTFESWNQELGVRPTPTLPTKWILEDPPHEPPESSNESNG
jgi:hypothetical protein